MKERGLILKNVTCNEMDIVTKNAVSNHPKKYSNTDEHKVTDKQSESQSICSKNDTKNDCEALALIRQGPSLFSVGAKLTPTYLDLASNKVGGAAGPYTVDDSNDIGKESFCVNPLKSDSQNPNMISNNGLT